jgi:hypothetical protein
MVDKKIIWPTARQTAPQESGQTPAQQRKKNKKEKE